MYASQAARVDRWCTHELLQCYTTLAPSPDLQLVDTRISGRREYFE